jgi:putative transposase
VKVYEEFDGGYMKKTKRYKKDEQVKFRLLVYSKEKVRIGRLLFILLGRLISTYQRRRC